MTVSNVSAGTDIDPAWGNAVADAINAHEDAWTTGAVAIGNLTVGASTVTSKYNLIGKTCILRGQVTLGAGFSIVGDLYITTLPVNAAASGECVGTAHYLDNGTGFAGGQLWGSSATTIEFHHMLGTGTNAGRVNATAPFTWASGDSLRYFITYETV
jgi:hypothetical protein